MLITAYDDIVNNALNLECQETNNHKQNHGNSQEVYMNGAVI